MTRAQDTNPDSSEVIARLVEQLHHKADKAGWPEAEWMVESLGWRQRAVMPDRSWVLTRLIEVLA